VQHMEAGFVGGKPGALYLHAAKGADIDAAIGFATPGAAPMFQSQHFLGAVLNKVLDYILVSQPVGAGDGVIEMVFEGIVGLDNPGGTSLGGNSMAAHGVDFRNQGNIQLWVSFGSGNGGTQASSTGTDNKNICIDLIHRMPSVNTMMLKPIVYLMQALLH
jgi:hypothetical protein